MVGGARMRLVALACLLSIVFAGCAAPPSDDGSSNGTVAFYVKDAPIDFEHVFVTFEKVEVHRTGDGNTTSDEENATQTPVATNTTAPPANATQDPNATATATTNATATTGAGSGAGWIVV